jgi:hypothetical protein
MTPGRRNPIHSKVAAARRTVPRGTTTVHLAEFILLLIATVAAIAAGLAMVASNYRVARVLFWIAALSFGSLGIMWSQQSHGYSLTIQMIIAAVCAAIAAASLVWGLDELRGRANAAEIPNLAEKPSPNNSTSGKNSPNITAGGNVTIGHIGDVTINQAPAPKLELIESIRKQNADGTFDSQFVVGVISPYPPSRMEIVARAPGVLGINIMADGTGTLSNKTVDVAKDASYGIVAISSMNKRFRLTVKTKSASDISLESAFE